MRLLFVAKQLCIQPSRGIPYAHCFRKGVIQWNTVLWNEVSYCATVLELYALCKYHIEKLWEISVLCLAKQVILVQVEVCCCYSLLLPCSCFYTFIDFIFFLLPTTPLLLLCLALHCKFCSHALLPMVVWTNLPCPCALCIRFY